MVSILKTDKIQASHGRRRKKVAEGGRIHRGRKAEMA